MGRKACAMLVVVSINPPFALISLRSALFSFPLSLSHHRTFRLLCFYAILPYNSCQIRKGHSLESDIAELLTHPIQYATPKRAESPQPQAAAATAAAEATADVVQPRVRTVVATLAQVLPGRRRQLGPWLLDASSCLSLTNTRIHVCG